MRQWVLIGVMRLPIHLRLLLAAQPKMVTPVLQAVHRGTTRHLLGQAGLKGDEADSGAVTLIQPSFQCRARPPTTPTRTKPARSVHCRLRPGLAGRAGPVARPLARHKQSTGLFVSGLGGCT